MKRVPWAPVVPQLDYLNFVYTFQHITELLKFFNFHNALVSMHNVTKKQYLFRPYHVNPMFTLLIKKKLYTTRYI